MIDTVKLSIPTSRATVTDRNKFCPTFEPINPDNPDELIQFMDKHKGIRKFIRNPLVEFRQQGVVYPNLEIYETYKRQSGYQCNVKPQVSIPKIIQGHSFEEVFDDKFTELISILKTRMYDLGIWVGEDSLRQAAVTNLHYCMNILFPSESEARRFLSCLHKMSMGERYENHDRDYANDGKTVRFYTKTFEWVTYLKYYDALSTGKDQVAKGATPQEREIVKRLLMEKRIPPLIRIEIRFKGKPSIRKHFKAIFGEDKATWTLEEVFNTKRSRKVMEYYWNKLMDNPINVAILCKPSREGLYRKLQAEFEEKGPSSTIFKAIGMFETIRALGIKEFRASVEKRYSRTTWYNQQKEITAFIQKYIDTYDNSLKTLVDDAILTEPRQLGLPL
jgi:hypothetical protein